MDGNGDKSTVNQSWEILYRLVLFTNYVMENIGKAIGEDNEKAFVRGEAYFVRARSYFELVNLYAKHYDAATAASELGVPKRLGTGVEETYTRASVAEIYNLIESDLKTAIQEFEKSGNGWEPSPWIHTGKSCTCFTESAGIFLNRRELRFFSALIPTSIAAPSDAGEPAITNH